MRSSSCSTRFRCSASRLGFHRYAAHKSFKTSRFFEGVLLIAGSMALEGPLLSGSSTHRRHHRYADEHGDPHSPEPQRHRPLAKLKGLWYAHIPWMFSDQESQVTCSLPTCSRDRRLVHYSRTYPIWALLSLRAARSYRLARSAARRIRLVWLCLRRPGPVFVANQAALVCRVDQSHVGSRPFVNRDDSATTGRSAIFTFGEGLQNNHHASRCVSARCVGGNRMPAAGCWMLAKQGSCGICTCLAVRRSRAERRRCQEVDACSGRNKKPPSRSPLTHESLRAWLVAELHDE